MKIVRLTVIESRCRSGYHAEGDTFLVEDLCPPICRELWSRAYPYVFALRNGAVLREGDGTSLSFTVRCPDGGRVTLRGEAVDE